MHVAKDAMLVALKASTSLQLFMDRLQARAHYRLTAQLFPRIERVREQASYAVAEQMKTLNSSSSEFDEIDLSVRSSAGERKGYAWYYSQIEH